MAKNNQLLINSGNQEVSTWQSLREKYQDRDVTRDVLPTGSSRLPTSLSAPTAEHSACLTVLARLAVSTKVALSSMLSEQVKQLKEERRLPFLLLLASEERNFIPFPA